MSYKATKPGLVSVLYLSMRYTVLLFIRAHFYVSLVFVAMRSVFWLFWLCYQYLPSDWLESLSRRGDRLQKAQAEECVWFSWFIVLLHCFIMYLCCVLPLCDIIVFLLLWHDIAYLC